MLDKKLNLSIKEFDYYLPADQIAFHPLPERDKSKLLIYKGAEIRDEIFQSLPAELPIHSSLILNDTKVIEARIFFEKETGGIIEIFCLEPYHIPIELALNEMGTSTWCCMIGGASKWKNGQVLTKKVNIKGSSLSLTVTFKKKLADSFLIQFDWSPSSIPFREVIHAAGNIPLPPYIKRTATTNDLIRYQTIFGKHEGSVAAPTAALHFTEKTFSDLRKKDININYITLHVGAGTFKPVKSETIGTHSMHCEPFIINIETLKQLISGNKIISVGTTSLRAMESLHWIGVKLIKDMITDEWFLNQWEAYDLNEKFSSITSKESIEALINYMNKKNVAKFNCYTSMMIVPGYNFQFADAIITNFHQPQSTLLLLISAFIGQDWKKIYMHAIENNYRFLSYGDSSLLWRE